MDPLILRFFERLTAVAIGGMSIYLGYRLFAVIPEHRQTDGKLTLPWNISIVLTRAAPGTFFALFGTLAVSIALWRPLDVSTSAGAAVTVTRALYGAENGLGYGDAAQRDDARTLLRPKLADLNLLPDQLASSLPDHERAAAARGVRDVKLELLKCSWGPDEGFGAYADFEKWVLDGERSPPPAGAARAVELFRHGARVAAP